MKVALDKLKTGYLYEFKSKFDYETGWEGLIITVTEHKNGYMYFKNLNRPDRFKLINSIGYKSNVSDSYYFIELGPEEDYPEFFI
jgi:hypothetical protein